MTYDLPAFHFGGFPGTETFRNTIFKSWQKGFFLGVIIKIIVDLIKITF